MLPPAVLADIGVGIASSTIYDFLKSFFTAQPSPDREELRQNLASFLSIEGAEIKAEKLIDFLARNGDISITGTTIYATDRITMVSSAGTSFGFGDQSTSETKNTKINAGEGAFIKGQGGAKVVQNEDGSISFRT
jgi:hypothetical protein